MNSLQINEKKLKEFAIALAIFCGIIGSLNGWRGHTPWAIGFLSTGIIAIMLTALNPWLIKPVFVVMMAVAKVIGWINTRLILILIFYLVVTPIGLLMRLFGKDLLQQKMSKKASTYWNDRPSHTLDPKHYEKQF